MFYFFPFGVLFHEEFQDKINSLGDILCYCEIGMATPTDEGERHFTNYRLYPKFNNKFKSRIAIKDKKEYLFGHRVMAHYFRRTKKDPLSGESKLVGLKIPFTEETIKIFHSKFVLFEEEEEDGKKVLL